MNPTVELIYDADCPNIEPARAVLTAALTRLNRPPEWVEWDSGAATTPAHAKGFGSPTILVNGKDVSGISPGQMPSCCRVYSDDGGALSGVPSVDRVVAALQSAMSAQTKDRAPLSGVGASVALAGLCPVCWTAYAGLLGSLGVGFILKTSFLLPATVTLLAIVLVALGRNATGRRGYGPLILGGIASAFILIARFVWVSDPATLTGAAVLVAASVWNVWPLSTQYGRTTPCVAENQTPTER